MDLVVMIILNKWGSGLRKSRYSIK